MSVLCATSFSGRSRRAVSAAADLAGRLGEPLLLVHAVPDEERRESAALELEAALRPLREQRGLQVQGKVLVGPAAEAVARFAEAERVDLL
ncbi:MAG TPA: universal stress protein, partial [Myxococcales bacterium]|nr:universal stress protein [Myxococcales bacterium]